MAADMSEEDLAVIKAEAVLANRPFSIPRQGDRKKVPDRVWVRRMSEAEARLLAQGQTVLCCRGDRKSFRVKITSIKTWVRKPDVLFGVKCGMYDSGKWPLETALQLFLVEV